LNNTPELYVSTISENPKDIFKNLEMYERLGVSGIHFDVMDGSFVPRFGLYPELMVEIKKNSNLKVEAHLMINEVDKHINQIVESGASRVIIHIESMNHPHRTISLIKQMGAEIGVALNPGTSINCLEELITELDLVLLMAINPGIPKHPFIEQSYGKISRLKQFINQSKNSVKIEVDGGVTFQNARKISANGANILVCGSGTFFQNGDTIENNIKKLHAELK
jgi:ribulose-phosphate 3-epimerase